MNTELISGPPGHLTERMQRYNASNLSAHIISFHRAAQQGDISALQAALMAGVHPDVRSTSHETALFVAAANGHLGIVNALIQAKADVNLMVEDDATALHAAAANGRAEIVRRLLDHGANPLAYRYYDGISNITPLHLAAKFGYIDIVRDLLQSNPSVDIRAGNGMSLGFTHSFPRFPTHVFFFYLSCLVYLLISLFQIYPFISFFLLATFFFVFCFRRCNTIIFCYRSFCNPCD